MNCLIKAFPVEWTWPLLWPCISWKFKDKSLNFTDWTFIVSMQNSKKGWARSYTFRVWLTKLATLKMNPTCMQCLSSCTGSFYENGKSYHWILTWSFKTLFLKQLGIWTRPLTPLVRTIIETGRPCDQVHTRTFYVSTFPSYFQEFFLYSLTEAVTWKSEITEPPSSKVWYITKAQIMLWFIFWWCHLVERSWTLRHKNGPWRS